MSLGTVGDGEFLMSLTRVSKTYRSVEQGREQLFYAEITVIYCEISMFNLPAKYTAPSQLHLVCTVRRYLPPAKQRGIFFSVMSLCVI